MSDVHEQVCIYTWGCNWSSLVENGWVSSLRFIHIYGQRSWSHKLAFQKESLTLPYTNNKWISEITTKTPKRKQHKGDHRGLGETNWQRPHEIYPHLGSNGSPGHCWPGNSVFPACASFPFSILKMTPGLGMGYPVNQKHIGYLGHFLPLDDTMKLGTASLLKPSQHFLFCITNTCRYTKEMKHQDK